MSMPSSPPLAYAVPDEALELERRLRRMIACVALLIGGLALLGCSWPILASLGVVRSQINFSWDLAFSVQVGTETTCALGLIIGGAIFWQGLPSGLWTIRAATLLETTVRLALCTQQSIASAQRLGVWGDVAWDGLSRLTWVAGAPLVLLLFTLTVRAQGRR
jgi:hypothetical protein